MMKKLIFTRRRVALRPGSVRRASTSLQLPRAPPSCLCTPSPVESDVAEVRNGLFTDRRDAMQERPSLDLALASPAAMITRTIAFWSRRSFPSAVFRRAESSQRSANRRTKR